MTALVYKTTGQASRSVIHATLVGEVHLDELPDDLDALASEYGGDYVEIINEDEALV